jgi:hypothetical protein
LFTVRLGVGNKNEDYEWPPYQQHHHRHGNAKQGRTGARERVASRAIGKFFFFLFSSVTTTVTENLKPEMLPQQFEFLGKEVSTFLKCLNKFPEFTDETVNSSILSFEGDLKVIFSRLI